MSPQPLPRTLVTRLCAEHDIALDVMTKRHPSTPKHEHVEELYLDAPAGYLFACDALHYLCFSSAPGEPLDWDDVLERLRYGLEPCTIDDCDVCRPD